MNVHPSDALGQLCSYTYTLYYYYYYIKMWDYDPCLKILTSKNYTYTRTVSCLWQITGSSAVPRAACTLQVQKAS